MIEITKEEAKYIREHFPKTHIHRTKHHYYCTEELGAMKALKYNSAARAIVAKRGNSRRNGR